MPTDACLTDISSIPICTNQPIPSLRLSVNCILLTLGGLLHGRGLFGEMESLL